MKLSLNQKSIDALREYASCIPKIKDNIIEESESLIRLINNYSDVLGPHYDQFEEMIQHIKTISEGCSESIHELAYMLNNTADKMDAYVNNGVSGSAQILNKKDIRERYLNEVNNRLNSNETNPVVRELYNKYKSCIRIADYDYINTPHYNFMTNSIFLNAYADMHNPTGNLSTYFHEVGHLMDDYAGNGHTWLSSDESFKKCLVDDAENYINKVMVNCNCERDEAYDIISDEISGNEYSAVSDIFGSLTNCCCQGTWGHSPKYWARDPSNAQKEAFANMFESSVGNEKKQNIMKKYFPTAYSCFERIIRSR